MNNQPNLRDTLKWITGVLKRLGIPYQVAGGLAARCYGSTRPVHDIDFYVPGAAMTRLEKELEEYIDFGPEQYRDEQWDIVFMKLNYGGQQIEFGDADRTRYFDSQAGQWVKEEIDFSRSEIRQYDGIELPVMPKDQLIDYKQRLNREVDRKDVDEMRNTEY